MLAKLRVINEVNNISLSTDVKYVNGEPWVKLSNSEYQFLQTWQVGQRQQDAELRFFAGLRKKIAPSNA